MLVLKVYMIIYLSEKVWSEFYLLLVYRMLKVYFFRFFHKVLKKLFQQISFSSTTLGPVKLGMTRFFVKDAAANHYCEENSNFSTIQINKDHLYNAILSSLFDHQRKTDNWNSL